MAQLPPQPPLHRLPPELLLQIAGHLRAEASASLTHLRNLCLVSKKLLPVAQEQLYADAHLPTACTCHPTVNAATQLLRTLLARPALAQHVKSLKLSVVRRNVGQLYQTEYSEKHLDLAALKKTCIAALSELGYGEQHPWAASLRNNVESAYAGLLLCVLPNLAKLQFSIKELHRGGPVPDPNTAFFATTSPPTILETTLMKLEELSTPDMTFLHSFAFENLKTLKLPIITVQTLLQLNGPNTFRGTSQLSELHVGLSTFLLDGECIADMQTNFGDFIDALACHRLSVLKIKLEHEPYCILHNSPTFDAQLLMDQLSSLRSSLKVLEIELNHEERIDEWDFILGNSKNMRPVLKEFTSLEVLKVPQAFLFTDLLADYIVEPRDLPKKLRRLEIICPHDEIIDWFKSIVNTADSARFRDLCEVFIHCREGILTPITVFSTKVDHVWSDLSNVWDIESYIVDVDANTTKSLVALFEADPGDVYDSGEDMDNDGAYQDFGEESDEDMPDLEFYDAEHQSGVLIDDMD